MKIKSIVITINRSQGKPLVYALNALTISASNFAMLKGVAVGMIESDRIRQRDRLSWERHGHLKNRRA